MHSPSPLGVLLLLVVVLQYSKLIQKIDTHKGSKNPILNFYYCDVMTFWPRLPWMLLFCVGNEMFLVCLYLMSFAEKASAFHSLCSCLALVAFPIFSAKQFFNVIQLADAGGEIADQDHADHVKAGRQ